MVGAVILQVILIFLNAIFASAEIAVVSMSEIKLQKMKKDGNKKAVRLLNLTANPARFLATIQVAITLAGFLGSAYAADNFAKPLVAVLLTLGWGISENALNGICVFLITLIIAYFSIVFGELVPKRVAMQKKEGIALGMSGVLLVVSKVFRPIVWLLTASTNGMLKLLGIGTDAQEEVTEEEIRMMVAAGSEKGTIDLEENELIQNVFEFNDIPLEEICTHRVDVIWLSTEDDIEEWDKAIYETRHNFYPVCVESRDGIIGVLDAKEYLRLKDRSKENIMKQAVDKPFFVPENMKADVLLSKMKQKGNYFAVLVDEYGGMSGIVTMRDIFELLVGDLLEAGEEDRGDEITNIGKDEWIIQGAASLDEVAEVLEIELPLEDYDTFSGYICGTLGAVPDDGVTFELETDDLSIQVQQVQERRILEAIVIKKEETEEQEEQA